MAGILNLTYIREDLSNYSISEYLLSLTSKNTRQSYTSNLYKFFRHIYPDQIQGRRLRGRKGEEFAIMVDPARSLRLTRLHED